MRNKVNVLVTGSRSIGDYLYFFRMVSGILDKYAGSEITFITGVASAGIDDMIVHLCEFDKDFIRQERETLGTIINLKKFRADWDRDKKAAGMKRNIRMVDYIVENDDDSCVLGLWDGTSKGTEHCLTYATKLGVYKDVHILRVEPGSNQNDEAFTIFTG